MTSSDVRKSFLDFFRDRGHRIVPSAPVIPHGDPTLLFTNAGMNQFKDVFLGTGTREYARAADTQKCIRVSGKHNDLEEVGRDTYHHTFFEMLGNWSFGDYYKKEAIAWAWELLTDIWGLDKRRLYATVFQSDDEAAELWNEVTDCDPAHILRFGKKDNFWEMGDTGPCGPCSEIHIDLTPDLSGGALVNMGDSRVMEIWNLVFIQHNRTEHGTLEDLPAKHVDTGMGFERVCAVLQGKDSNYDTDVFAPLLTMIEKVTRKPYNGEANRVAMRVIADHVRMLTFAIADGAIPGNEGRGYVLRRILRRAARYGRNLAMQEPFVYQIVDAVVHSMGDAFPEITERQDHIKRVVRAEEESFNATLDRGLEIFESVIERIGHSNLFPGEDAFKLYDTYGFPIDLTQLIAEERGLAVDVGTFTELMEEQKSRSRDVGRSSDHPTVRFASAASEPKSPTEFLGYAALEAEAELVDAVDTFIILNRTPFYAEAGGQVGDTGKLSIGNTVFTVVDTKRERDVIGHRVSEPLGARPGERVQARVDRERRFNIQRNHSATHLVHEALRRVLGTHVHQQGSLVAPDRLRFDFPHFGKISPEEIRAIEEIVNGKIAEGISVVTEVDMPIDEARKIPHVKMFFGDKYGERVRVVFIDENFSVEFCGGTHVVNTNDIGLFKIVSESSIASGVRRIEAVTGEGIRRYIDARLGLVKTMNDQLARLIEEQERLEAEMGKYTGKRGTPVPRPSAELILPTDPAAALESIETNLMARENAIDVVNQETADLKKELGKLRAREGESVLDRMIETALALNGFKIVASKVDASDMDQLKHLGDVLRAKMGSGVGVLGSIIDEKVALVCVVTDDLIKSQKLQAGKIVGELAKRVGGGGGGRPHLATAGGKDIGKLDETLRQTPDIVKALVAQ